MEEPSEESQTAYEPDADTDMDARTDFGSGPAASLGEPLIAIVGMPGSGKVVEAASMDRLREDDPAMYEAMVVNDHIERMEDEYFADELDTPDDPDIIRSRFRL